MLPQNIHILLIEDDQDDVMLFEKVLLTKDGTGPHFMLKTAPSLDHAVQSLQETPADVIVLDLGLPGSRGTETLTLLQRQVTEIPIVVLTSLDSPDHAIEVIALGAQDYLVKGETDHQLFRRTILYAIERHKIRREHERLTEELKIANSQLEKLALLDPLTNLLNRRGLQDVLSREIEKVHRSGTDLLALILDLDNFKVINDTLGHAVGDVALKEISRKLLDCVRSCDYVARIGGDEFMVIMPQTRTAEGMLVAAKIRRAISGSPVTHSFEAKFNITASLGMVVVTPDIVGVDELIARTHHVLYKSKNSGKNRVSYDDDHAGAEERDNFTSILEALKNSDDYHVVRQPIISLDDNTEVGYEFLSRFSVKGLEMPDDFFRACQENNILTLVDRYCLKNCVRAGGDLPDNVTQHINVFPSTMIDIPSRSFMQAFEKVVNYSRYCVEISEQQIIGDPSYLIESVRNLKRLGIRIAIDDVGFGRSCLESLILLEPDIVKIDRKWVNNITNNTLFQKSLKKLMKVSDSLGAVLVAEGIETEEDANTLRQIGVPFGQGYYWGRPA